MILFRERNKKGELMKKMLRKTGIVVLCVVMLCAVLPVRSSAGFEIPGICQVQTDAGTYGMVKTLDYAYENNTYLSLRDMAMILRGTDKFFSLEIAKNTVSLNPGEVYAPVGVENTPWEESGNPDISLRRNECKVSGQKVSYYTLIMELPSGYFDCFMMAADLAMILDVDITAPATDALQIRLQEPFLVSPEELERDGYFYGVNGVLVGDASTGEVYYGYQADEPYPIASTSKLMTCLLTLEAVSAGQISLDQQIVISEDAWQLAQSDDGVVPFEMGGLITVRELLVGTLLPSSNECALCLAEAVAGSEEAFVQMMNEKASELGLSQAVFFNCNGLPVYTEGPVPSKRQNRMSAEDMFRLVSYLLKVYPQITEITSLEKAGLESIDFEVRNTNPLLYNLSGVTGLKTGTTNKAGACLITSLTADDGVAEHDLVVIVLGAEDSVERTRVSELLARYALKTFETGEKRPGAGTNALTQENLPVHAEAAVEWIIRTARKR